MAELLELAADLPQVDLEPGAVLMTEGAHADTLYLLVSGALAVRKGDVLVAAITEPGAAVGEISVLLGGAHSATVEASGPTRVAVLDRASTYLRDHPELLEELARLLAHRLQLVTSYLADLKQQYGDEEGNLGMIDAVLTNLVQRTGPRRQPGSERDPEPLY